MAELPGLFGVMAARLRPEQGVQAGWLAGYPDHLTSLALCQPCCVHASIMLE